MTNEQTTEIILRKRTQSMQSDSCTLSGQERVSLSLLALPKYMHLSDTSSYSEILQKINDGITCQKNRMEGYYNLCACQILEMMILVSRQFVTSLAQEKTGVVGSYRKIYDLLDYLNNCYREPISGVLIEEQLGGNFDYLNRIFRQTTGKTIFQYLTEVRISHAKELLGTTSLKISQVSEKSDFPMKVISVKSLKNDWNDTYELYEKQIRRTKYGRLFICTFYRRTKGWRTDLFFHQQGWTSLGGSE